MAGVRDLKNDDLYAIKEFDEIHDGAQTEYEEIQAKINALKEAPMSHADRVAAEKALWDETRAICNVEQTDWRRIHRPEGAGSDQVVG